MKFLKMVPYRLLISVETQFDTNIVISWLGFLLIQSSIKLEAELLAKCNVVLVVATVLISEAMSLDATFSRRCGS